MYFDDGPPTPHPHSMSKTLNWNLSFRRLTMSQRVPPHNTTTWWVNDIWDTGIFNGEWTNKQAKTNKSHAWVCFMFSILGALHLSSQKVVQFVGTMMLLLQTSPVAPLHCMSTSPKHTKIITANIPVNGEVHLMTVWQLKGPTPCSWQSTTITPLTNSSSVHLNRHKITNINQTVLVISGRSNRLYPSPKYPHQLYIPSSCLLSGYHKLFPHR
jgi:hypothetical protein